MPATMTVELSHAKNPDVAGGYWVPPTDNGKARRIIVKDYAEAAKVCVAFIEGNEFGGGNWSGGAVRRGEKQVAYVSYNGKVWPGKVGDYESWQKPLYPQEAAQ